MPLKHVFRNGLAIAFREAGFEVGTELPLSDGYKEKERLAENIGN